MKFGRRRYSRSRNDSSLKIRLLIGAAIILFSVISFLANTDVNPVTGEKQRVGGVTVQQEIALGLHAAPEMARRHGGFHPSESERQLVEQVGLRLVNSLNRQLVTAGRSLPYQFQFHLLADDRTVNAFALPGGQIFITYALYSQFRKDGQIDVDLLAGVLGHEIGHVIERHGAEQMAKGKMFEGITNAAVVIGGNMESAQITSFVTGFVGMKYSRQAELESDRWGVRLALDAGFRPQAMLEVMDILERSAGTGRPPEFVSTHPSSETRKQEIRKFIEEIYTRDMVEYQAPQW
ncbi:MAG TPA: M48 family metallopeptidase [Pirellulaceae bacterium]|nr:M48 family metallopeptidase [Pirellulaceae bacterium]HMO92020.1 M48 family metallopeptidase [Pirellulaceae bacterium]HMP68819.1 M48 family metallopeptidase [Pirellulaceae bacterium]